MEAALSLVECASVSAGAVDASLVSMTVRGGAVHLRGNHSNTLSVHQVWMFVVIKAHTLLSLLQDAALAPVLADGTALRMTRESGECVSCLLAEWSTAMGRETDFS